MHPILFSIGDFAVHSYGVLIALGTILAVTLGTKWSKEAGFHKDMFTDLGFWSIVAAVIGARLEYVRTTWHQFDGASIGQIINVRDGGLVFYGGLIGVLIAFSIIIWRKKLPPLKILDILAPLIPFGIVFGRSGCLMAGCCYGLPTDLPWAVTFTHELSVAPLNIPLHPTQIYEVLYGAGLFGLLVWMRKHVKFDGQLILTFLTLYPLMRSANELLRGDAERGFFLDGSLSNAQAISVAVAVVAGIGWVTLLKKNS
ncbi:MAG: prolipoprotein diacylglyceryl transferase [Proteobacteria bacterium]|nr:prolipoprotein diacylglyceryl transferase [Pseudomonadota bacterium]MCP4916277.1 prolipoprotein diacylglyceryl transferase [Pseudomonadota bacterium]